MAFDLKLDTLTDIQKENIVKTLYVRQSPTQYDLNPPKQECYIVNYKNNTVALPLGVWHHYLPMQNGFPNGNADEYDKMNSGITFVEKLLTAGTDPSGRNRDQDVVIKQALERLDKYGSIFLSLHTGFGKCLGYGTEILMFDGTKKEVQNIVPGELIMGDDSTARTILSTCQGEEEMYEICLVKGENYIVNESHILSVKYTQQGSFYYDKKYDNYRVHYFDGKTFRSKGYKLIEQAQMLSKKISQQVFDISMKDYLTLSNTVKEKLKCFWVPIEYPVQDVILDPYFLGLWLGDGCKRKPSITTADYEIMDYLESFVIKYNVRLRIEKHKDKLVWDYHVIGNYGKGSSHHNYVKSNLQRLKLICNKHIPQIYKINSRYIRLKVLAGLIDSDGYYKDNGYEIMQKLEVLAYDIQDLCRSLGYACFINKCKKGCWYKNEYKEGDYYRITFYGKTIDEIPVLLPRKKAGQRLQIKDPLVTGFTVKPLGVGKYYGFTINGNRRFVLGSHMVTHNTASSIYLSIKLGLKTVVLSHLDVVKQQWAEEYTRFTNGKIKIQFLNKPDIKLDPKADVYIVGIHKALSAYMDEFIDIGTVIIDEAHIATVTAFTQTLFKFRPRYLIGLSATPNRNDGLNSLFNFYFGKDEDFIVRKEKKKFTVYKVETDYEPVIKYKMVLGKQTINWNAVVQSIEENEHRWRLIVDIIIINPNHKIIVLCNRKILSNGVYNLLIEKGEDAELLIETKKTWNKEARILVAGLKKGGVGLNDPKLTMAIIASDTSNSIQFEGRLRTTNSILYHMVDDYQTLHKHYKACEKFYIEKGATVKRINKGHILAQKYLFGYFSLKHLDLLPDAKNYILTMLIYSIVDDY